MDLFTLAVYLSTAVLLDGNLAISVDFNTAQDVEKYTIRVVYLPYHIGVEVAYEFEGFYLHIISCRSVRWRSAAAFAIWSQPACCRTTSYAVDKISVFYLKTGIYFA